MACITKYHIPLSCTNVRGKVRGGIALSQAALLAFRHEHQVWVWPTLRDSEQVSGKNGQKMATRKVRSFHLTKEKAGGSVFTYARKQKKAVSRKHGNQLLRRKVSKQDGIGDLNRAQTFNMNLVFITS